MKEITEAELLALEKLCAQASPAPWIDENHDMDPGPTLSADLRVPGNALLRMHLSAYESAVPALFENAEFIAAARSAVPQLLALVRHADSEILRLHALVKRAEWAKGDEHGVACICPWCGADKGFEHADDCPAFTPEGEVR